MVVSVWNTDLLIVHDWNEIHRIEDPQTGNADKFWIDKMPGFDPELFPFPVVSGSGTFNLINVRKRQMQPLIQAQCKNLISTQAFFFRGERYGFSMHFCTGARTNIDES